MKVHIFVATTQGLVAIQNITAIDDADISSVVSLNGTSTTANISNGYHSFVKKGAGIIQQDFGACSYRININKRIDQGNSWQLAFYLAHAAEHENILGNSQVKVGDHIICATGEVSTTSRNIHGVADVTLKQKLAAQQIRQWRRNGINVNFLIPKANLQDLDKQLATNSTLVSNLAQALSYLPLNGQANNDSDTTPKQGNKKAITAIYYKYFAPLFTASKNKTKSRMLLVSVLCFSLLATFTLTQVRLPISIENKTSPEPVKKAIKKIPSHHAWKIALLTNSPHEIDESLLSAYSLIEKTITEQLIIENFEVIDKTLLTDTPNITELELLQIHQGKVNLAIRFNFSVNNLQESNYTNAKTWQYELSAYLVDLNTKKKIESHNEYGKYTIDLTHCDKNCFSLWLANNAKKLAQDMGAIIAKKLNKLSPSYQFEINFRHFLASELMLIDNKLKSITHVVSSRLLQKLANKNELLHQISSRKYSYISYLSAHELNNELSAFFEQKGISIIATTEQNNTLTYSRSNMPYNTYYLLSGALLFGLLTFLTLAWRKRHFVLARKNTTTTHQLMANSSETTEVPSQLSDSIINETLEKSTLELAILAFENKEYYKAYSLVDSSIQRTSSMGSQHANLGKLKKLHRAIEKKIPAITRAIVGHGALKNHAIFPSSTVELGRNATNSEASFSIDYQHVSRIGKQCVFSREDSIFYLRDQGSTNGNTLNNTRLAPQQKMPIVNSSYLVLDNDINTDNIAICQLNLKVTTEQPPSLVMQLESHALQFIDFKHLTIEWPSFAKDMASCWVLLGEELPLSIDNGQLKLGCEKEDSKIFAYLIYQEGFYIRPSTIMSHPEIHEKNPKEDRNLRVNQQVIYGRVPINEKAIISFNGYEFGLSQRVT
jgi:hypothetical protein